MRSGLFAIAIATVAFAAAACGPIDTQQPEPASSFPIVTTERGPSGGRLVFVAEDGRRMALLTNAGAGMVIDTNPAWSVDGKWLAFASSRDRESPATTSLWVVEGHSKSAPRRLTTERSVDRDPVWLPDGSAVIFASNAGGNFDLWRLPLARGKDGWPAPEAVGKRLTKSRFDELSPTLSPDGKRVVYMRLDRDSQRSNLWSVPVAGGRPQRLTRGPADLTPSYSPDGKTIAFAAPVKGRDDTELFTIAADGSNRRQLVDEPLSDQTGPRWSKDGRYVFATSVYRSKADGKAVLSSLVVVDRRENPAVVRALHDPAAVASRIGAAIAPVGLDDDLLHGNEPYDRALKRAMVKEVRQRQEQSKDSGP